MRDILRLDANEGRPEPSPSEVPGFLDVEAARRYPDPRPLEAAIAQRYGLPPGRVVVAAGGDDAIDRLVRSFARSGRPILGTEPAFVEYAAAAARAGLDWAAVPRPPEAPFPSAEVAKVAAEIGPALIIAASPDNPGGGVLSLRDLDILAGTGFPLLLDATYAEFAEDQEPYRRALALPACVLVRSFSKAYGLAGLRVGWAAAPEPYATMIRRAGPPYPVAGPSLAAALAALEEGGESLKMRVERVRFERAALSVLLAELGAKTWPAEGNFVPAKLDDPAAFVVHLAGEGIAVKHWPGVPNREGLVRITCPGEAGEFSRLVAALRSAPRGALRSEGGRK
jgi:histidinol-phosphate/aromatic aminotransferase/cobyric acid decarboxylase-like protein